MRQRCRAVHRLSIDWLKGISLGILLIAYVCFGAVIDKEKLEMKIRIPERAELKNRHICFIRIKNPTAVKRT